MTSLFPRTDINLMVDIETTGKEPGCKILQIGAVPFFLPSDIQQVGPFRTGISKLNSESYGFVDDSDTLAWWKQQDSALRARVFEGTTLVRDSLENFSAYIHYISGGHSDKVRLWAKGSDFDFPILKCYYEVLGIEVPWKYNNIRDYRTLVKLFGHLVLAPRENRTPHDALADAQYQAEYAENILEFLEEKL